MDHMCFAMSVNDVVECIFVGDLLLGELVFFNWSKRLIDYAVRKWAHYSLFNRKLLFGNGSTGYVIVRFLPLKMGQKRHNAFRDTHTG